MKRYALISYLIILSLTVVSFVAQSVPLSLILTVEAMLSMHLFYLLQLGVFALLRYFWLAGKSGTIKSALSKVLLWVVLPLFLGFVLLRMILHRNQTEDFIYAWDHSVENAGVNALSRDSLDGKLRGMSAYALGRPRNIDLDEIVASNVEWIAVHPYLSQPRESDPEMSNPPATGNWSSRDTGFIDAIRIARARNLRIMLKPHLWVTDGWRGNINFATEGEWDRWFANYRTNLLHYARLAETTGVEMLCIGTELHSTVARRSEDWVRLIEAIKEVYGGKLTYAANWNDDLAEGGEAFWRGLDFVGIQAYFPLTERAYPTLEDIQRGWGDHLGKLEETAKRYGKPLLFTELGYRPDGAATVRPWEWYTPFSPLTTKQSERTQLLAYEAFFQEVWPRAWLAGVFVWQWNNSVDFSVRGRPAQNCLTNWYGKVIRPRPRD